MVTSGRRLDPNALKTVPLAYFTVVGVERPDARIAILVNVSALAATSTSLVVRDDYGVGCRRSWEFVNSGVVGVEG